MSPAPSLGPRAIASYRRLELEIAALKTVLSSGRPTGQISEPTLLVLDGIRRRANKLFCRHAELPFFPLLASDQALSQTDFAVLVQRLATAIGHFAALHADQLAEDDWEDWEEEETGDDGAWPGPQA